MTYQDQHLTCRDCGSSFVFTAGEQEFYQSRGLQNEPRRCPECRAARRASDGNGRTRVMHQVICSNCGKQTEVPFEPRLDKPVYCNDCFTPRERSGGYSSRGGGGSYGGGSSYGDRGGGRRGGRY